jgi:Zn-dependent M28 family amino/carboxypeptidase
MNTRRIVLSTVATSVIWFQAVSHFEARAGQAQPQPRPSAQAQAASKRIDSERLMSTVTTMADPKWEGRAAGSPGGLAARAYVLGRFKAAGLQPVAGAYEHPFKYSRKTPTGVQEGEGANVLGICPGTDPKLPYFVVSAHYDHVGVRDGQVYPGADDNASGVAVILELAAFCQRSPFRHSILFAAFDAEERGLQGARALLAKPPVPRERMGLNINLDMVGRSDKREIYVAGTHHYPDLKSPIEEVARRAPIKVLFGHDKPKEISGGLDDWTQQSDHGPFHDAKIPFVYFGVEDHADYHQPTDTAEKIAPDFLAGVATVVMRALDALDRAPAFQ